MRGGKTRRNKRNAEPGEVAEVGIPRQRTHLPGLPHSIATPEYMRTAVQNRIEAALVRSPPSTCFLKHDRRNFTLLRLVVEVNGESKPCMTGQSNHLAAHTHAGHGDAHNNEGAGHGAGAV